MDNIDSLAKQFYDRYISDKSIVGFDGLLRSSGFGSKRRLKIRNRIYELYGKDGLVKMYRSRLAKSAHKNRTADDYVIPAAQRRKMIDGIRQSWENADDRKKQAKQLMVNHCHPKAWLKETNEKRIHSRKNGMGWNEHSDSTCQKISTILKQKWKDGCFDNRRPTIKSKGQLELCSLLREMEQNVVEEFRVNSKPFDACLPKKKLLFEFNGTYWHLDPRTYEPRYWDKFREQFAFQIWRKDNLKNMEALRNGYNVITIWQVDWDKCQDKKTYLKELIDGKIKQ